MTDYIDNCVHDLENLRVIPFCGICAATWRDQPETSVQIEPCGHKFHRECLLDRFNSTTPQRNLCPNCEVELFRLNALDPEQLAKLKAENYDGWFNVQGYKNLMVIADALFADEVRMRWRIRNWNGVLGEATEVYWRYHPYQWICATHMEQNSLWTYMEVAQRLLERMVDEGVPPWSWCARTTRAAITSINLDLGRLVPVDMIPQQDCGFAKPADAANYPAQPSPRRTPSSEESYSEGRPVGNESSAVNENANFDSVFDIEEVDSESEAETAEDTAHQRAARRRNMQEARDWIRQSRTIVTEFRNVYEVDLADGQYELRDREGRVFASVPNAEGYFVIGDLAIFYRAP
ncbi:hypothetical protein BU26DRAFT_602302 [Trematosphaeria pertusa]|uniref:RING-type domain-containing protein n=1 Tax=Trematosphaeria pertusa TaxID=390896 RepID=A0A6A6IMW6_9PLEO|nr:uncharacterized protein BU26DRAFT_602302 [Trematosphaeria pertusa]KAF2251791.1 hypothetical protein BU26DRAFT_602302 [Trematosphaeria pertusa]